jgi:hypothetical protein
MFAAADMADFEMKAACESWYFDHTVVVRSQGARQLPYGGMPLLSLRGFTDWISVESSGYPDRAWRGFNAALQHYGVWAERGPMPREVLPASMPAEVQQRIDRANERGRANSQQKLSANASRLALEQQGRQNALDLIGNVKYVYR